MIHGKIIHRECDTRITTYQPLDRDDHRIVVIVENAHTHPLFPALKVTPEGKRKYTQAVEAHGPIGLSVVKCDNGKI